MRNLAKLSLLFSLSFAVIFLVAAGLRFLALQAEWAQTLPQKPETSLTLLITAAHWALSLAMYSSILLSLGYAARNQYFALMTVICVMILSMLFNFGVSTALDQWKQVPPARQNARKIGGNGLILSNAVSRNETAVILLNGIEQPLGPRVVAFPDRPLWFQDSAPQPAGNADIILPPIPFGNNTPWFIKSLSIDLRLSDEQIQKRFDSNITSYFIYAGSLIFLLCSLGFAIKFSAWPLANLFIGALAFRGILAVETFFNSPEMQEIFDSFFRNLLPVTMAVPLIFFGFGLLIHLYSILVFIAKKRDDNED
jgi:hypothetical protein